LPLFDTSLNIPLQEYSGSSIRSHSQTAVSTSSNGTFIPEFTATLLFTFADRSTSNITEVMLSGRIKQKQHFTMFIITPRSTDPLDKLTVSLATQQILGISWNLKMN
jgi:hypothetical protein